MNEVLADLTHLVFKCDNSSRLILRKMPVPSQRRIHGLHIVDWLYFWGLAVLRLFFYVILWISKQGYLPRPKPLVMENWAGEMRLLRQRMPSFVGFHHRCEPLTFQAGR
jgi:hypothetical protein